MKIAMKHSIVIDYFIAILKLVIQLRINIDKSVVHHYVLLLQHLGIHFQPILLICQRYHHLHPHQRMIVKISLSSLSIDLSKPVTVTNSSSLLVTILLSDNPMNSPFNFYTINFSVTNEMLLNQISLILMSCHMRVIIFK